MGFKFIHMADVHLDTPFACREKALRSKFISWTKNAFSNAVDFAICEKVNAVLIAGDLFDSGTMSFASEIFLMEQMKRLYDEKINVFYAPGNHDPYTEITRINWPQNVTVFSCGNPVTVDVTDNLGRILARITGAGHETGSVSENLVKRFEPCIDLKIPHIGLIHTMVAGFGGVDHDRYAPSGVEDMLEKNYVYWALGHIHKREKISDMPCVLYPGNLIGRNPKETGQKGIVSVEIHNDKRVDVEFVPVSPVVWSNIDIDELASIERLDEFLNFVKERISQEIISNKERLLLRVNLKGPALLYSDLKNEENINALKDELSTLQGVEYLEIDNSLISQPVIPDDYRGQPHILSTALDILEKLYEDDELLLKLKPEKLAGLRSGDAEPIAYLRMLLNNMEYDLAARLLKEEKH